MLANDLLTTRSQDPWRQNEKLKEYLPRADLANMEGAGE